MPVGRLTMWPERKAANVSARCNCHTGCKRMWAYKRSPPLDVLQRWMLAGPDCTAEEHRAQMPV